MKLSHLTIAAAALMIAPGLIRAESLPALPAVTAALPHASGAGTFQKRSLGRLLAGAPSAVDSLHVIVFRVSFADRDFGAAHDATYSENELAHLREYYIGASRGLFHLRTDLAPGVVSLSGTEAYYGDDELWKERMAELLIELVEKTDASIDFSRYDAFAVIHAGAGQETDFNNDSQDQIASGFVDPGEMAQALKDTLGTPGVPTNDRVNGDTLFIDNLMVWPEEASQDGYTFGSLGIYAYQVGLRLGMVPLFDTTPSGYPDSQGLGNFDLMSYGIYNALGFVPAFPSAFNRYLMGWVDPIVVDGDEAVRLSDVGSSGALDTALVKVPINASEYYLIENRVHDTNFNGKFDFNDSNGNGVPENGESLLGAEFDFFLTATTNQRPKPDSVVTGSGLMIYHVDESAIRSAIEAGGNPNDDRKWKGVDLEEADHIQDLDSPGGAGSFGSFFDSFRALGNDRFGPDTDPSTADNADVPTGIEVGGISDAGHVMTFDVRFAPRMDRVRCEFPGDAARLSPIPADVNGDGIEELVVAADTGRIYIVSEAGSPAWAGSALKVVDVPGAVWAGPPVFCDIDGDVNGIPEMFITSWDGTLYAFEPWGAPFTIDDDGSPESLKLRGDLATSPVVLNVDSDARLEIVVFTSTPDSTFATVLGSSDATPAIGWRHRGVIGAEKGMFEGRLASHPATGANAGDGGGVFIARHTSDQKLDFNYLLLRSGLPVPIVTASIRSREIDARLNDALVLAAGAVDGSGSDCVVAALPGEGLCFWDLGTGRLVTASLRGAHPSSPVLADVDGDGTLETAVRDDQYLYLFSGFGTPVTGWPKGLDDVAASQDRLAAPAPPVIADVNGDGHLEVVFRVAGDLHAFDFSGREIGNWPLPGEGGAGGSVALLEGQSGRLYVFDCASSAPYTRDTESLGGVDPVVALSRYAPGVTYAGDRAWPFFRHDARGTGRQTPSAASTARGHVDPSTFIVFPNPVMGGSFTARVLVSGPARVKVTIINIEGEKVVEREKRHDWPEGSAVPFEEVFSTGDLSAGVYICRIEATGGGWSWTGAKKFAVIR